MHVGRLLAVVKEQHLAGRFIDLRVRGHAPSGRHAIQPRRLAVELVEYLGEVEPLAARVVLGAIEPRGRQVSQREQPLLAHERQQLRGHCLRRRR